MICSAIRRRGTVSFATVFVVMSLAVLLAVIFQAGRLATRKVETGNCADAASHAGGVQLARGMNSLVTVNHLIGELLAIVILANTPTGDESEAGVNKQVFEELRAKLSAAYGEATRTGAPPDAAPYERLMSGSIEAGAAIGAARRELIGLLTASYSKQARTGSAPDSPRHAAVLAEWIELDRLEALARGERPIANTCQSVLIAGLSAHARAIFEHTPARAIGAAEGVARDGGMSVHLFPNLEGTRRLELPVVSEKESVAVHGWERSQMVRATTPWVQHLRGPTLALAEKTLPLSRYAAHYREWSNRLTLEFARRQGESFGTYLYVLRDTDPVKKGREPWTQRVNSPRADELFGWLCAARMKTSSPAISATAQVMLYNANPQVVSENSHWQPVLGWDTLNWDPEVRVPEFARGQTSAEAPPRPSIRPNWRAKLTPVTLLANANDSTDPVIREAARTAALAPNFHANH